MIVVLAEKPSVARDLAAVLGARTRKQGFFEGNGYRVTWAIGHLVGLAQPHEIEPSWKAWSYATLPMLPEQFPLVVLDDGRAQFRIVERLLRARETTSVIAATDAGREGELIFRYIYERVRCKKPWRRLWISSLTPSAIRDGFERLQDGSRYDGLAAAAKARSRADWLVGMNLSRAYTLSNGTLSSVGRVQTPTLAMVVERDRQIRAFVPEHYFEVEATFESPRGRYCGTYHARPAGQSLRDARGKLRVPAAEHARLPSDGMEAEAIVRRAREGRATLAAVDRASRRTPPPLLYDLTELQRHANRRFGFSAKQTLDAAQALYERHKLLSYPRTDSRHLSPEVAQGLPQIVAAIAPTYEGLVAPGSGERPLGKRFVDASKVTDHHALIPTSLRGHLSAGSAEAKIYDLVCRRLLMAWHADRVEALTTLCTEITPATLEPIDLYVTRGSSVEEPGWSVLERSSTRRVEVDRAPTVPPGLEEGEPQRVVEVAAQPKQTEPPRPFTEATLLTAMETAGKTLDDKALMEAMRESGLGTPATRAAIIETLLGRNYLVRHDKELRSTPSGETLVDAVHPQVKSAGMTGSWELRLRRMERGDEPFDPFMRAIEAYVREVVSTVAGGTGVFSRLATVSTLETAPAGAARESPSVLPATGAPFEVASPALVDTLQRRFGHAGFRPRQAAICEAVCAGRDVLCVMPTGAGKSLCYQLPGLVRGGTTIVISPLIALIEDQCGRLVSRGLRAERIHSGLDREAARATCFRYLRGELDYLFIAPERLGVPGFPAMLAKRPPALIAVDEAHCISQWGHDFRPDYRLLRERLAGLRPTPIIALTATATERVQRDIIEQLAIPEAAQFVLGFRRDNLAIELVRCAKNLRSGTALALLSQADRLPAIIYTPTRAAAERVTELLRPQLKAATYHAGLSSDVRGRVQGRFLDGALDCIVATIAFGMGIDKSNVRTVIHTASPSSLEAYYQEIGRAGRDGLPSRAIMLHGPTDRRTHDFFLERDYPTRRRKSRDANARQRAHRVEQLDRVEEFLETKSCRMSALVKHFGDLEDASTACGHCDVCAPNSALTKQLDKTAIFKDPLASSRRASKRGGTRRKSFPSASAPAARKKRRTPRFRSRKRTSSR